MGTCIHYPVEIYNYKQMYINKYFLYIQRPKGIKAKYFPDGMRTDIEWLSTVAKSESAEEFYCHIKMINENKNHLSLALLRTLLADFTMDCINNCPARELDFFIVLLLVLSNIDISFTDKTDVLIVHEIDHQKITDCLNKSIFDL